MLTVRCCCCRRKSEFVRYAMKILVYDKLSLVAFFSSQTMNCGLPLGVVVSGANRRDDGRKEEGTRMTRRMTKDDRWRHLPCCAGIWLIFFEFRIPKRFIFVSTGFSLAQTCVACGSFVLACCCPSRDTSQPTNILFLPLLLA